MNLDWMILDKIQDIFGSGFMDFLMPKITFLGNGGMIWIIIGVLLLISKKHRKIGFLVLIGLLMGLIIGNGIVKNLVARPRPCWLNPDFPLLISVPKDYSFPSGHTCASFAAGLAWAKVLPWRWARVAAVVQAVCMGLSRLYVGVHYPSDVLAGAMIGGLCALCALWLASRNREQRHV